MKWQNRLHTAAKTVIFGFGIPILLFLSVTAWICDGNQTAHYQGAEELFLSILILMLAVLVTGLAAELINRFPKTGNHILFGLVFVLVMAGCIWWIVNADSMPDGDSKSVYDIAVRAMNHDLLPVAPTGSYLSLWPYQSGLILYYEVILRMIPGADYLTIQYFNLLFVALTLISAYVLVRKWFASERVTACFSILMGFCLPFYFYVNFLYGEVPGLGLLFFASWMLTEYLEKRKWWLGTLAALSMAGAVMLRKNSWIFVIACLLLLTVYALVQNRKKLLFYLVFLLLTVWGIGSLFPQRFYELRARNTMGEGVPILSTIAMGLQDGGGTSAGGWNGYDADLFMEYDFDGEIPTALSRQSIRDSLENMLKNPAYGVDFFYRKMVSQWCDESYNCFYITKGLFGDRTDAAWKFYGGEWYQPMCRLMNYYQNFVYAGGLCFCLLGAREKVRKKEFLFELVFLVTVIGGFLFSTFWEGGSRYVMPYLVMLLPYAASGIVSLAHGGGMLLQKLSMYGRRSES